MKTPQVPSLPGMTPLGIPHEYYVVRTGQDRFDLRQTRYRAQHAAGREHPHDIVAVGFTADDMRAALAEWFDDTDTSALPPIA